jgi:glycosyltransferase involved in cell wall biosynthesis
MWTGKKPVIITVHDLYVLQDKLLGFDVNLNKFNIPKHIISQMIKGLHSANGFACVSNSSLKDLQQLNKGKLDKPVEVIYNGFNFPFQTISYEEIKLRLATINPALFLRPFILHIGSNIERKNRKSVLEIANLASRKANIGLVIAGDWLSEDEMQMEVVKELNDKIIQIHKPTNEVLEALYNLAHCLVFPSFFEGFGWPIIEAQACGCPVICSNTSSLPEIVGINGLIFNPLDINGMSDAILSLFTKDVRETQIRTGKLNSQRFKKINLSEGYGRLYQKCLTK